MAAVEGSSDGPIRMTTTASAIRSVGIIAARGKSAAATTAAELARYLEGLGRTYFDEDALKDGAQADLLVVLGGDGAILRAAHRYPGMPILGVNFGQVGFLAVAEQSEWRRAIDRVLQGDCILRDEPTVDVKLARANTNEHTSLGWFMNDVVIRSRG